MITLRSSINSYQTPRKCCECQKPATMWKFTVDRFGAADKSSRTPVCEEHAKT